MRIAATVCALAMAAPAAALGQTDLQPIPHAGDWHLSVQPTGCFARLRGREVDTMVIINRDGKLVLTLGHRDWNAGTGSKTVTLQIDDRPPVSLQGDAISNIVLVPVFDDKVARAVRNAHRLRWTFPFGRYGSDVTGFRVAYAAVQACPTKSAAPTPRAP